MQQWIGTIGGVIGLIVFLGATVVYLRGSKDKGTISTLTDAVSAFEARVDQLEKSEKRLTAELDAARTLHKAEMDAMHIRVESMEVENERLLHQRPSADAIEDLRVKLEEHDTDLKAQAEAMRTLLEQVAADVKAP